MSYVQINSDGTFDFMIHIAMGTCVTGHYAVEEDVLTLTSDIGEFKFYIRNKKLIFYEGNYLTDNIIETRTIYTLK